jgi:iron complex outermembrane receptor protein
MKNFFTLLTIFLTSITFGQVQDSIKVLDEVTITASRFKLESVASKTIQLDSVKNYHAQETPYFFSTTPSVVAQSDNGTPFGYSYFTLRGMGQNRINYTLNGVPLNDGEDLAVYTSNYTDLLNSLRSVQITRGAGVSANGSSSYIGLVNMDLTSPFDNKSGEFTSMLGSFSSRKNSVKFNTGVTKKGFGATFRASETYTDGFRDFSSGRSTSFSTSLGYRNEVTSIRFNVVFGKTKNGQAWLPVPEGLSPTTNVLASNFGIKPQYDDFTSGIYQLQVAGKFSEQTIFSLSTYFTHVDGNYDMPSFSNPTSFFTPFPKDEVSNLKLNSQNWGAYYNVKHTSNGFTIQPGFTINSYSRKHIGTGYNTYQNLGEKFDATAFTKASYKLGLDWIIEGDYQFRSTTFTYKNEAENFGVKLYEYNFHNYSFGLSYRGNEVFKPYLSFGKSSREPSRTNIFGMLDNINSSNFDGINSSKYETVHDIELGTKIKTKNITGSLNLYNMRFENEIIPTCEYNQYGIALTKNADKSYRIGIEGDFTLKLKKIEVGSTFNISKNKVWLDTKTDPALTPNFTSNLFVNYTFGKLNVGTNYKYVAQSFLNTENTFISPEYHLVDMYIGYKFNKSLSLNVAVNNLLNKNWATGGNVGQDLDGTYTPTSTYRQFYYTAGTNTYLTLNYKF